MAQEIQPSGKKIGLDAQGNAIYQVQANGIEIGYKLIGSGEPLVMIMGIANTMERWPRLLIEELAKKYQLILLDNRGVGNTSTGEDKFTYTLFADDVIGLLDSLKIKKAHIFGVSMGSGIAQEILLKYPKRINKAIICSTSIAGSHVAITIKDKLPKNPIVQRQFEATIHWEAPLDQLSKVTIPVMVVIGTADTVVGVQDSKTLATTIPGAWLIQYTNASHLLIDELPSELAASIFLFLGSFHHD